jgi:putative ABC transport system permease protein
MGWWMWVRRRWDVMFRKSAPEKELDEEIRFHLDMEIRQNLEAGMEPGEARRRALVAFGGVERFKEQVRDVRGARVWDDLIQDSRVTLRALPKQPAFLLAVLLTLGLGIGGNVAMVGVLERSIFRALPYPDAADLVLGRVTWEGQVGFTVSGPDFFDYREQVQAFRSLAAITPFPVSATITGGGEPERVLAPGASVGFFETFGVLPAVGRYFLPEEGEPGGAAVAVLSHGYWQRRFGGHRGVVGSTISLDGTLTTVVGVAPPGFRFLQTADLWRPIQRGVDWASARQFHNFVLVGRLAEGATVESAQAEVDALSGRLAELYPDSNRDKGLNVTYLREALTERYLPTLRVLMAAVVALLLIACANVAGLLLARGNARRSELAVRSVMGAGRGRLARQLLTENVHLALGAGVLGAVLAIWIQRGILGFVPMDALGDIESGFGWPTMAFALALSMGTVLLFGVLPSVRVARTDPAEDLKSGGRGRSGDRSARFRSGLVVVQVAMTTVLLAVSGLLFRSFQELVGVEPGFDAEQLMLAEVQIPRGKYPGPEEAAGFFTALAERVQAVPGVMSVGMTSHIPIRHGGGNVRIALPEDFGTGGVFGRLAWQRRVLPGYFASLGVPLLAGRDVEATDDAGAPPVVVLSESLARDLFGDRDPLGAAVAIDQGGDEPAIREVIGIVGDVKVQSLAASVDFAMYFPYVQAASARMGLAVRARGDMVGVVSAVREALRGLDPDVPLDEVTTMEEALRSSVSDERTIAVVLTLFAVVALLLASVGLYGVLAYQVSRRFHEIGVRMALGASVSKVTREVVAGGLRLTVLGLLVGLPGAWIAGRLVQGMLFGVEPADPLTLAGVVGFLASVALAACALPAHRAARVDPVEAFRAE